MINEFKAELNSLRADFKLGKIKTEAKYLAKVNKVFRDYGVIDTGLIDTMFKEYRRVFVDRYERPNKGDVVRAHYRLYLVNIED